MKKFVSIIILSLLFYGGTPVASAFNVIDWSDDSWPEITDVNVKTQVVTHVHTSANSGSVNSVNQATQSGYTNVKVYVDNNIANQNIEPININLKAPADEYKHFTTSDVNTHIVLDLNKPIQLLATTTPTTTVNNIPNNKQSTVIGKADTTIKVNTPAVNKTPKKFFVIFMKKLSNFFDSVFNIF